MKLCEVVVLVFGVLSTNALNIPDFIKVCKRSDPNLNECAKINGDLTIPELVKGHKKYQIPFLTPLEIDEIHIQAGKSLRILLTKNQVHGLEKSKIDKVDMQLDKKHMIFNVFIPNANLYGQYEMNGKILALPIIGNGLANITFVNGYYLYSLNYKIIEKKGKEYMNITDHNLTFKLERAYYHFTNLFNGNQVLGDQMNEVLNDNWEVVTKDLGSTVGETISRIITTIISNIFIKIPFNQILPP